MRRLTAPALLSCAALVSASDARAGDEPLTPAQEAEKLDDKERELRDELFREPTGRRSRFATEVELGTQVDWVNRDQHGTLHGGFGFSFSPRQVENLRIASFYAGIAVGQIGDEAHRWVHLETGWRPNFEVPVDSEFKPFLGGRHLVGMSSIGGDDGVDGTLANGASVGVRMLGGLLSVELHGDAMFSWNREFLVDGERTHWVPRFGFNVKSDFCAFAGGDICEYPAPTPEEIDLSAFMDAALAKLRHGLSPPPEEQCARAEVAVTLRVDEVSPECGVADAAGFFCRFKSTALGPAKSETEDSRLIELARMVHGDLETCYNQSRVDERAAAAGEKQLQRKLRYGAYPPELRTSVCRKSHDEEEKERAEQAKARQAAASTPEDRAKLQKEDEAAAEQRKADSEKLREKVERARYACPRAAKSFDTLAERVHQLKRPPGPR